MAGHSSRMTTGSASQHVSDTQAGPDINSGSDSQGGPRRAGQGDLAQETPRRIDPRLLAMLVCPLTKTQLEYDARRQVLISRAARLAYPIQDGIPVMLPDEALPLEDLQKS